MSLTLTVSAYKGVSLPQPLSRTFDKTGGSIGRMPECELFLNDPDKFVSRRHGAVRYADGSYYLQDLSTQNPIRLNQNPLGTGKEAKLRDGDTFAIGDYVISVALAEEYASLTEGFPTLGDSADSVDLKPNITFSNVGSAPSTAVETLDSFQLADDQAILSKLAKTELGASFDVSGSVPKLSLSEHVAPVHEPMHHVKAVPDRIPDDYDPLGDSDIGPAQSAQPPIPYSEVTAYPTPDPQPGGAHSSAGLGGEILPDSLDDFFAVSPTGMEEPIPSSLPIDPSATRFSNAPNVQQIGPDDATVAASEPPARSPPAYAAAASSDQKDAGIFQEFLAGAGLAGMEIPSDLRPQVLRVAGEIVREFVQGSIDVLAARATIKNELRAQRTILTANENNPLKFSPDAHYALTQFFTPTGTAYLPPVKAVREAFDDLKEHEMAVMAGLRGALESLLRRIDPERLINQQQEPSGLDALLPSRRKAKLWHQWERQYKDLKAAAGDDFERLIGSEFVAQYEEYIRHNRKL
jgi:FHA domain-containing protein/type VI secretion system protein